MEQRLQPMSMGISGLRTAPRRNWGQGVGSMHVKADHLWLPARILRNNSTLNLAQHGMLTHFQCLLHFRELDFKTRLKMQWCWRIKCMCSTSDHNIWKDMTHVLKQVYSISHTAIFLGKTQIYKDSLIYIVLNTHSKVKNFTHHTRKHRICIHLPSLKHNLGKDSP